MEISSPNPDSPEGDGAEFSDMMQENPAIQENFPCPIFTTSLFFILSLTPVCMLLPQLLLFKP